MEIKNSFRLEDNRIIHTRLLQAPIELVWEVWTNPEHFKKWWGPTGFTLTIHSMEVEAGKFLNSIMHGWGRDFQNMVEYVEVIRPTLLAYKLKGEREDYDFSVRISFESVENKTLMVMESTFKSREIIEELNLKVNAIESGKQTLNRLENYLQTLGSGQKL